MLVTAFPPPSPPFGVRATWHPQIVAGIAPTCAALHHISCQHGQNPAAGSRSANPVAQHNRTGADREGRQDGSGPMVTIVSACRCDASGEDRQILENNVFRIGQGPAGTTALARLTAIMATSSTKRVAHCRIGRRARRTPISRRHRQEPARWQTCRRSIQLDRAGRTMPACLRAGAQPLAERRHAPEPPRDLGDRQTG